MAGLGRNVDTDFSLTTKMTGRIGLGGNNFTSWLFTDGVMMFGRGFMGDRDYPSAHLEYIEGRQSTLRLSNMTMMQHTIHLHGLDVDQQNDGVPSTSFAVSPMGTYTYRFIAPPAGTYHYHCHVDTVLHYVRGMHGTIIVRPPGGETNLAWTGGPTFDEEVLWQLGALDSSWLQAQQSGPQTARFRPDAFLLNGQETADARRDRFSKVEIQQGEVAYIRVSNGSYLWARVSLDGLPFAIVASDGRPMLAAQTVTEWEIGPGERYDILLTGTPAGTYSATIDYLQDHTGAVLGSVQTQVVVS